MNVLRDIIARTAEDLIVAKALRPLSTVVSEADEKSQAAPALDVLARFRDRSAGLNVIAEVKRSSPSAGALAQIADPAALASVYAQAGSAMVSVLTEPHWFHGSLTDLMQVRAEVATPILRKDFIVDEYQIAQARAAGADCVLLIVAGLADTQLADLLHCSREWSMEPLVEVHSHHELHRAIDVGATIIGVNARDLTTLKVNPGLFAELASDIPADCVAVAESGIATIDDARAVAESGADAILVGQALVQSADPAALISSFSAIERGRR